MINYDVLDKSTDDAYKLARLSFPSQRTGDRMLLLEGLLVMRVIAAIEREIIDFYLNTAD